MAFIIFFSLWECRHTCVC